MDAVKLMGEVVRETAELTKDNMCMGDAKLVVFCNAPEDNPFMAGAFHGAGERVAAFALERNDLREVVDRARGLEVFEALTAPMKSVPFPTGITRCSGMRPSCSKIS